MRTSTRYAWARLALIAALCCLSIAAHASTQVFLTNSASTTWQVPLDWNPVSNTEECIGSGGNGGTAVAATHSGSGGGSGVYASINNTNTNTAGLAAGVSVTIAISAAGGAVNTTLKDGKSNVLLLCKPGVANNGGGSAAGGLASASTGFTKVDGCAGSAGASSASPRPGGGGAGAPGPSGACTGGGTVTSTTSGAGGNANGGAETGGAAVTTTNGNVGVCGTEWDSTHGTCSGPSGGGILPGNGGLQGATPCYGAGGAGGADAAASVGTSSAGCQGMLVITYTPRGNATMSL